MHKNGKDVDRAANAAWTEVLAALASLQQSHHTALRLEQRAGERLEDSSALRPCMESAALRHRLSGGDLVAPGGR